jgi:two-component system NarL family response regulator
MEVLRLLAEGLPNKELARALAVTEDTIKTHVRHILEKLEAQSRTQAVLAALRLGLISLDEKKR